MRNMARYRKKKPVMSAHRASWLINRGPVPEGMNVLHRCDVRHCVNPEHLFLGTQKENVADAVRKGRSPQSTKRTHCKLGHELTPENVYRRPDNRYQVCRECIRARKKELYYRKTPDSSWVTGLLFV